MGYDISIDDLRAFRVSVIVIKNVALCLTEESNWGAKRLGTLSPSKLQALS